MTFTPTGQVENITLTQDMDEMMSRRVPWELTIFNQVDRINKAMTNLEGNFMLAVEALDMDLAFYHDDKYKMEMAALDEQARIFLEKHRQMGGLIPSDDQAAAAWARAKEHGKVLMRLIGRWNLYPESVSAWRSRSGGPK